MKYHVIAIEREYASGGQEIGEKIAKRLGIPCYGHEILKMAAEENGVNIEFLEDLEEKATSSILYSVHIMTSLANMGKVNRITNASELFVAESNIIRRITQTPAVIVGWCAVDSLRDRKDVLRVFIHADLEARKKRAVESYGIEPDQVGSVLHQADKRRGGYYKINTGMNWKDIDNYHMVLDSGLLGVEKCVDILEQCFT